MSHTVRNNDSFKRGHMGRQLRENLRERENSDQLRMAKRGVYDS